MNTEIWDYLKKISQKEFFFVNLINSILGIAIILLAIYGLNEEITVGIYGGMFGAGAIMLLLNFYKGVKKGNKNKWIFLIAGIIFAAIAGVFIYAFMR